MNIQDQISKILSHQKTNLPKKNLEDLIDSISLMHQESFIRCIHSWVLEELKKELFQLNETKETKGKGK